jgi:uncharacterized protein YajQ (UPF0234 family)
MPSFDIVSQVNEQEVKNAVEQTNKEITNRFTTRLAPIAPLRGTQAERN